MLETAHAWSGRTAVMYGLGTIHEEVMCGLGTAHQEVMYGLGTAHQEVMYGLGTAHPVTLGLVFCSFTQPYCRYHFLINN